MVTRDPDASFDTPNVVIGRQGRNELTLCFRPLPYLHRLLVITCGSRLTTSSRYSFSSSHIFSSASKIVTEQACLDVAC